MNIYVKPAQKARITGRKKIFIKDIAEISPDNDRVSNIEVKEIKSEKKCEILVDIIDIINALNKVFPNANVINVGEKDIIVEYFPKKEKENKVWLFLKISFVSLLLFAGASTAIMSFHSDAQMAMVFEKYYEIFFNEKAENPILVTLPYSIGLAVGIIVFFNHFALKSITDDPTPIEVEMTAYEKQVDDNIIETLSRKSNAE